MTNTVRRTNWNRIAFRVGLFIITLLVFVFILQFNGWKEIAQGLWQGLNSD